MLLMVMMGALLSAAETCGADRMPTTDGIDTGGCVSVLMADCFGCDAHDQLVCPCESTGSCHEEAPPQPVGEPPCACTETLRAGQCFPSSCDRSCADVISHTCEPLGFQRESCSDVEAQPTCREIGGVGVAFAQRQVTCSTLRVALRDGCSPILQDWRSSGCAREASCLYDASIINPGVACNPDEPECTAEYCFNGLDDDCDGLVDASDDDCREEVTEDCSDGIDNDGDGALDCGDSECQANVCGGNSCFTSSDDPTACIPGDDDDGGLPNADDAEPTPLSGDCDETCGVCKGKPVHLVRKKAFIGPHEDVRLQGATPDLDIVVSRIWDSARADVDHADDVRATSQQLPYARVLGPGWRHNYDIRLVLEDSFGAATPHYVRFVTPERDERLYFVAINEYGRVPGHQMHATRVNATDWVFVDEDGTTYQFKVGAATQLHPAQHARLVSITPPGVTGARVRLYYEQDADQPAYACTGIVDGSNTCDSNRGLLAVVRTEWRQAASQWLPGSGVMFQYAALAGTKPQLLLRGVRATVDMDDGASAGAATLLAEYQFEANRGEPAFRHELARVATCIDQPNPGASCMNERGAQLVAYVANDITDALIDGVIRPYGSKLEVSVWDERFEWVFRGNESQVLLHQSRGIELVDNSASPDPQRNGVENWTENGRRLTRLHLQDGKPVVTERCTSSGDGCVVTNERSFATSPDDPRVTVGAAVSMGAAREHVTLKSFFADGDVDILVEAVPVPGAVPSMTLMQVGDCTVPQLTGVDRIVRATRTYRTPHVVPLTAAVATYVPTMNTAGVRFLQTPHASWWSENQLEANRPTPQSTVACAGQTMRYDVDATDYDAGTFSTVAQNGRLNEATDRQVAFVHHAQALRGRTSASSTRRFVDPAGRMLEERRYASLSSLNEALPHAAAHLQSRASYRYFSTGALWPSRLRGRLLQRTEHRVGHDDITFLTCPVTSTPYDVRGDVVCSVLPGSDGQVQVRRQTRLVPYEAAGSIVQLREQREALQDTVSGQVLSATFRRFFASGLTVSSGVVAGNFVDHTLVLGPNATKSGQVQETRRFDGARRLQATTRYVYDAFGQTIETATRDANNSIVDRVTSLYDAMGRVSIETRTTSGLNAVTETVYDDATDRVQRITEPDGDVVVYAYGESGAALGQRISMSRNGVEVQRWEYDDDGRVATVEGGDGVVARYTYDGDGQLRTEALPTAGDNVERRYQHNRLTGVGGEAFSTTQVMLTERSRAVESTIEWRDAHGRLVMLCDGVKDSACARPVVRHIYDDKPQGELGHHVLEDGRSVDITNDHQDNRVAWVRHPAGETVYEYDSLGRVVVQLDRTPQGADSIETATELQYANVAGAAAQALVAMRYPSGIEVRYGYDRDASRPTRIDIVTADEATTVLSDVQYDARGQVAQWTFGEDSGVVHRVERTIDNRISGIVDEDGSGNRAELRYLDHDGDGDAAALEDRGTVPGVLTLQPGTQRVPLAYDAVYESLTQSTLGELAYDDSTGLRMTETTPTSTLSYVHQGEQLKAKRATSGSTQQDLRLSWKQTHVTTLDAAGTADDVTDFSYGPRGDTIGWRAGNVRVTHERDHQMNRWWERHTNASGAGGESWRFHYGPNGQLLERVRYQNNVEQERDAYVYLAGQPVALLHRDTAHAPSLYWLSGDALGTPRRVFVSGPGLVQISRLVMDPWGQTLAQTDDRAGQPVALPTLPFRLPGQTTYGRQRLLVDNKYRSYVPAIGMYTSVDPLHRVSVSIGGGPQVYAYASERPLAAVDPDGRVSFDRKSYEINCDKCCSDYEPEAGQNTALRWAARPACRLAWSKAFSGQSTLSDLLISPHPKVRYERLPQGVVGQYRRLEGVIVQDCRTAKRRARNLSANNLIHELSHFLQWRRDMLDAEISFWMNFSSDGPIESEAYGIASACLGSLGSTQ